MKICILSLFAFCYIFTTQGFAAPQPPAKSQSLTIGHQTQSSFEIREFSQAGNRIYSFKAYRDRRLTRATVLTKQTYQQIQKDWKFVLPTNKRKLASAGCDDLVRIERKIANGVQTQIECRSSWSKTQAVRFDGFIKGLRAFANGEKPFYSGMSQ